MNIEIDDDQREEIERALLDRKETLEKLAETEEKKRLDPVHIRRDLKLYTTDDFEHPGLLQLFKLQPELSEEKRAKDKDLELDLAENRAETGGGHPAGERVPGKRKRKGKGEAQEREGDEPIEAAAVGASVKMLGAGDAPRAEATDVEFEIIEGEKTSAPKHEELTLEEEEQRFAGAPAPYPRAGQTFPDVDGNTRQITRALRYIGNNRFLVELDGGPLAEVYHTPNNPNTDWGIVREMAAPAEAAPVEQPSDQPAEEPTETATA